MIMTLTEIENLSPVEIEYHHSVDGEGQYHFIGKYIVIDKDLEDSRKIECLLHEIGHAVCDANNCKCMSNRFNHILAEYHAMRFSMKYIKDNPMLIKTFVNMIASELTKGDSGHKTAAKRIVKLKQWEKLCKAI